MRKSPLYRWIRISLITILLMALFSVSASAKVKKNADGTLSYYKNGKIVKNQFIKEKKRTYCADRDGILYVNGIHRIGHYYYAFSGKGIERTGKIELSGKTYYFSRRTGRMLRNKWVLDDNDYYYFKKDGTLAERQWVGLYYVDEFGCRVTNAWKDNKYLGEDGKAVKGLKKIDDSYYYFSRRNNEKLTNLTKTISGVKYSFDEEGKGTVVSRPVNTSYSYHGTYYSDPKRDQKTLLGAIIFCEAGNQCYSGQLAVGAVIMNRVYNNQFPAKMKQVIYQRNQFAPAANGMLTRALKNTKTIPASCLEAAEEILGLYKGYTEGKRIKIPVNARKVNFSEYLYFMGTGAYGYSGSSAKAKRIQDHVFLKSW